MKTKIKQKAFLLFIIAICLVAALYAGDSKTSAEKGWNSQNATWAFNMALTRSAHDQAFRSRLTASPESAKQAVAEEGNISIPDDVVIMSHEGESNENYHIFDLPKFDEKSRTPHVYREHFECCYQPW